MVKGQEVRAQTPRKRFQGRRVMVQGSGFGMVQDLGSTDTG